MIDRVDKSSYFRLVIVAVDSVSVLVVLSLFYSVLSGSLPALIAHSGSKVMLLAVACMLTVEWIVRFPRAIRTMLRKMRLLRRCLKVGFLQSILFIVLLRLLWNSGEFFRFLWVYFPLLIIALCVGNACCVWYMRRSWRKLRATRIAVWAGDREALCAENRSIGQELENGYNFIGYYSDDEEGKPEPGLIHLGGIDGLIERLKENTGHIGAGRITDVFYCLNLNDRKALHVLQASNASLAGFHLLPYYSGELFSSLTMERLNGRIVYTAYLYPLFYLENRLLKRVFDVVVSGLVCVGLLPLLPLFAWLIKRESKGGLFFSQLRSGLDGREFVCYKFRSMHINRESDERMATKDDERVFRFGKFMRRHNLDELPQFFNVLKGDMSIVGPRPHMVSQTEEFRKAADEFMIRHFCKPGITGWAQVSGARGEIREEDELHNRIEKDLYYMKHWSFWLDIKIVFLTIKSIFAPDKRAY